MRILYLHQYFKTPEEGGAIRSYYLATAMAEAGHKVELITGWDNKWEESIEINGFTVHYVPAAYSNLQSFSKRKAAFIGYLTKAYKKLIALGQFDLAYVSSTPLTIGLLALYLKWFKQTQYIFEIRDLWPEAPWQLGAINRATYKVLKVLEKKLYRNANGVVALSPPMQQAVKIAAPSIPNLLATNMADVAYFKTKAETALAIDPKCLEEKFVISYTGTAGKANNLQALLPIAEACAQQNLPVLFLIMADGMELTKLQAAAKHLTNVQFLAYSSKEAAKACLQASDAQLISFADYPVLQSCSPNKFFDGLAAGKLIITNTSGWIKELIEQHHCGFYFEKNSPAAFIEMLLPYLENKNLLLAAQQNASALAKDFSRAKISQEVVDFIEKII